MCKLPHYKGHILTLDLWKSVEGWFIGNVRKAYLSNSISSEGCPASLAWPIVTNFIPTREEVCDVYLRYKVVHFFLQKDVLITKQNTFFYEYPAQHAHLRLQYKLKITPRRLAKVRSCTNTPTAVVDLREINVRETDKKQILVEVKESFPQRPLSSLSSSTLGG